MISGLSTVIYFAIGTGFEWHFIGEITNKTTLGTGLIAG